MWPLYTILSYFVLALVIPVGWSLGRVWLRTRKNRCVTCPRTPGGAVLTLNAAYAVRMHAVGNPELRILTCSRWPEFADCAQECLLEAVRT